VSGCYLQDEQQCPGFLIQQHPLLLVVLGVVHGHVGVLFSEPPAAVADGHEGVVEVGKGCSQLGEEGG